MKKALTLSLVIPVYNEEHHLKECLEAVASQTIMPDEVIIVDNNSTDKSVGIARQYPFVRLIREKRQGLTPARNHGFNYAKGDILGRIDADSVLAKDWVERVHSLFNNRSLDGITGLGSSDLLPRIKGPRTVVWSWLYFQWTIAVYGMVVLWGANMAIRSSAWQKIKDSTCLDDGLVHEDQDLSLLMHEHGFNLHRENRLRITTGGQTYHHFPKLITYTGRMYNTRRYHLDLHSLQTVPRQYPLARRLFLWLIPGPIVLSVFFLMSLLLWPLDLLMARLGRVQSWLD